MQSFPKFTGSTLWGEFAWVGEIIFGWKFMVRGQFSGGKGTSGAIDLEPNFAYSN